MSFSKDLCLVKFPHSFGSSSILEIEPQDSVSELVQELRSQQRRSSKRGAWLLLETWHHCKRQISPDESVFEVRKRWGDRGNEEVRLQLKQMSLSKQSANRAKASRTNMKGAFLSQPRKFFKNKWTHKRLYCAKWVMKQALRQSRKRYSNMLLNRIVKGNPLWGPLESTPLDSLQAELSAKKDSNLQLSSEIADLNIKSTRLRNETHPLRQREQELLKKLSQLQKQVIVKREEKERRGPRDLNQVQTDIIKLKRELEARNRLNASHTSKLKAQKELLAEKRRILQEKQRELETLKSKPPMTVTATSQFQWQRDNEPASLQQLGTETDEPDLCIAERRDLSTKSQEDSQMPICMKEEIKVPMLSTSRKRHTSKFEAKTKQLVEEEGKSFRRMQSQQKHGNTTPGTTGDLKSDSDSNDLFQSTDLDTYRKSALNLHIEGPDVLVIPKEDAKWYESQTSQDASFEENQKPILYSQSSEGKERNIVQGSSGVKPFSPEQALSRSGQKTRMKVTRKVDFVKEALILNAALEGDLQLLKECVKELGSSLYTSDKGATCLHNAVCSGNMEMVEYLVEMGCDINAQDIDGWTPLHCAAAYHNLDLIRFLVQNGSSLFLATQDGDTPLKIAIEEYEVERQSKIESDQDPKNRKSEGNPQMAVECLHYLMDIQTNVGVSNQGQVYALFSRPSAEPDELSISKGEPLIITNRGGRGEQWWMARNNMGGQMGVVPCTFLGPHFRHSVLL